jgi:hypothetical protein
MVELIEDFDSVPTRKIKTRMKTIAEIRAEIFCPRVEKKLTIKQIRAELFGPHTDKEK